MDLLELERIQVTFKNHQLRHDMSLTHITATTAWLVHPVFWKTSEHIINHLITELISCSGNTLCILHIRGVFITALLTSYILSIFDNYKDSWVVETERKAVRECSGEICFLACSLKNYFSIMFWHYYRNTLSSPFSSPKLYTFR
jgi:hypothetical protein